MEKSKPSDILILQQGETVLHKTKGDCYQTPLLVMTGQVPGDITFTDRRILFRGGGLIESARLCFSIDYADIRSIEPYLVFVFPTGIRVRTSEGAYRLSVRKRNQVMELIKNHMN